MTKVKVLRKEDLDALYRDFPNGRPLNFATPAAPGGFSLVAALSNFFEKLGLCEKTPDWVRQSCEEVRREKKADGSLTGTTKFMMLGHGNIDIPNEGSLIRAKSKDGSKRIAMLLDFAGEAPRGWLIAAWDGKTGQPEPFPI
jgi:hypothetical protein